MVSKRKLETNRQNAILSTGPSNTAATRWNALTHGILSKEVLITVGDGQEDAETFEEFANPLRENLSPVGALEELLVDQLTILTWRWRRVLKYEAAAIRQKSDTAIENWDRQQYKNRLDYPALYGRWRWESQTDLFAGAASLKLDLEALDTEDPIAIRPDICVQVFNVAREQFGVPIHEILGFKMLLDNHWLQDAFG